MIEKAKPLTKAQSQNCIFVILLMLIAGCATNHRDVSQSDEIANNIAAQDLSALAQYKVRGKLAIITDTERKSAYLSWQQDYDALSMSLNTVVGTNIARLQYDGVIATLVIDEQSWQAESPSELIYRVSAWQVPVDFLDEWMKGQVNKNLVDEFYVNGLVKQFTSQCEQCLPWTVTYNSYAEFLLNDIRYTLPTSLRLEQADTQTTLVLRIDKWLPADA